MADEPNRNGTDSRSAAPPVSLGAWKIRAWRKREGMTSYDVAAMLGVSQAAVHFWESGKKVPRHGNMAQLMALGVCVPNDWHQPAPAQTRAA